MHNRGATTLLSAIHVSLSSIEEHAFTRLAGMFFSKIFHQDSKWCVSFTIPKANKIKKKTRDENCRCHLYFEGRRGESRELPSKLRIDVKESRRVHTKSKIICWTTSSLFLPWPLVSPFSTY